MTKRIWMNCVFIGLVACRCGATPPSRCRRSMRTRRRPRSRACPRAPTWPGSSTSPSRARSSAPAIVAGGPYDCAEGSLAFALQRCMATNLGAPDPRPPARRARGARAARGEIDPLAGLADDRVYVFSGTDDTTVTPPVVATVADFYRLAGVPAAQIEVVDGMPAGHAFITEAEGNACAVTGPPFVNDCDYDQAGAILAQIYGPLAPPAAAPAGRLVAFDQGEFLADPTAHGLAADRLRLRAGRLRGRRLPGARRLPRLQADRGAGRRRGHRAASGSTAGPTPTDLIVLYPQTHATGANPNACWDWWGYDDAAYATKAGRQMAAVKAHGRPADRRRRRRPPTRSAAGSRHRTSATGRPGGRGSATGGSSAPSARASGSGCR